MSIATDLHLIAREIPHDRVFVGTGARDARGAVRISTSCYLHNVSEDFVDGYKKVAVHDVVGQLYLHFPDLVQRVAVADYGKLKTQAIDGGTSGHDDGAKVSAYLLGAGIHHLMIAGLESEAGLAWITFYRDAPERPFLASEAEAAKFLVPAVLYHWQKTLPPLEHIPRKVQTSIGLLPLTVREIDLLIRKIDGWTDKAIGDYLGIKTSTVESILKNIRKRLGPDTKRLTHRTLRDFRGPNT